MRVTVVLHADAEVGGGVPVPGDNADVVVEARFECGLENFDHLHALGDDEKIVDEHGALDSVAVVINFEEKAGVR